MLKIIPVETEGDIKIVSLLLEEYLAWMESNKWISSQESQSFEEQLANLPNGFIRPGGCLMFAEYNGQAAGCVALRKLCGGICEMKRLYVRPQFRGLKIGRKLAEAIIAEAQKIGYTHMRLHSLQMLEAANSLYRSLRFMEIAPYEENIIEGGVFMELKLV